MVNRALGGTTQRRENSSGMRLTDLRGGGGGGRSIVQARDLIRGWRVIAREERGNEEPDVRKFVRTVCM